MSKKTKEKRSNKASGINILNLITSLINFITAVILLIIAIRAG